MTIPTTPFPYNYKVWDVENRKYILTITNRREIYDVFVDDYDTWSYREVRNYRSRYFYDSARPKTRLERDYRLFRIHNHFGDDVTDEILTEFRERYRYRWSHRVPRTDVRYKKGNPHKIKRGYSVCYWDDDPFPPYENDYKMGYFREFHTFPERRRNEADVDEYGQECVRAKRRNKNLPNPYDDLPNASQDMVKSWKHNSKRRHQYKIKD